MQEATTRQTAARARPGISTPSVRVPHPGARLGRPPPGPSADRVGTRNRTGTECAALSPGPPFRAIAAGSPTICRVAPPTPIPPAEPLPGHGAQSPWFAVVAPGGEAVAARELAALPGTSQVAAGAGGVAFRGDLDAGLRANLWLRSATRILLRVGSFRARDFERLRRGVGRTGWKALLPPDAR